jgi:hypothetical protein
MLTFCLLLCSVVSILVFWICAPVIWFPHILQPVTAARVVQGNVTATQDSVIVVTMLLARSVIAARQITMDSMPVRFVTNEYGMY